MLRVLELFAGIGACSKALTNLGIEHEIVDAVEIDKFAVQSFNAIHGTNFAPQDITEWDKDVECDLIMHGSPCQDFSVAGRQAGGDKDSGTRSSLMYETLRIVEKLHPKYVIWENVKNLLSKKHRHNFDAYLEAMERLGYHSQYQVLNARDYGVPQNRERVFTVSIRNDLDVNFRFPEPRELTIRLKDILEPQVDEKYYLSDEQVSKIELWENRQVENGRGFRFNAHDGDDIATTMTTSADRLATSNYYKSPKEVRVAGNLNHYNYDKMNRVYDTDGSAPTVDTMGGGNREPKIVQTGGVSIKTANKKGYDIAHNGDGIDLVYPHSNTRRGRVGHGVAKTLPTTGSQGTLENFRIRKLTPKECWRLMGFDDDDFERAQASGISNSQLYKQAGNSIVVDVLEAIFKNLLDGGKNGED